MKAIIATSILAIKSISAAERAIEDDNEQGLEKTSYSYVKLSDQWFFCPGLGVGYRS